MKLRKAVFPAAGFGTRFLPATKASPKEMLPIVDTPIIQLAVEEAIESGIEEIIIVTGRGKSAIENHFDKSYELEETLRQNGKFDLLEKVQETYRDIQIVYVRQPEMKGLGDAILRTKNLIGNEPFAVILADDVIAADTPCLKQMIEVYNQTQQSVIASMEVPRAQVSQYGILVPHSTITERTFAIAAMVEKPQPEDAPSQNAIIGRYILTPTVFDELEKTQPGKGGELQLTDALATLLQQESIYGFTFEGRRFDAGSKLGFLEATCFFALQRDDIRKPFAEYLRQLLAHIDV